MDRPKTPARSKTPGLDRARTPFERAKTPGGLNNINNNDTTPAEQYFQVYLRLRPPNPLSSNPPTPRFLSAAPNSSTSILVTPPDRARSRTLEKYDFTKVFPAAASQLDIFTTTVLPLVQDAVQGRDGMLATLGVTGSGKTHTMLGDRRQRGMTQLALDVVFASLSRRIVDFRNTRIDISSFDNSESTVLSFDEFLAESKRAPPALPPSPALPDASHLRVEPDAKCGYAVLLSMYELYNDRVFDLLDDPAPGARRKQLSFRSATTGPKKVITGLRKVWVRDYPSALTTLFLAQAARKSSPTNSNHLSSRSHAFFQIEILRFSSRGTHRGTASLHTIDLAGSERSKSALTGGERLAEAGSINRSLMTLGQCLEPGGGGNWRSSKLTELMFTNMAGMAAVMIVTADAEGDYNSTLQMLRYSASAREVTVAPTARGGFDDDVSELEIGISYRTSDSGRDAVIARLKGQVEEAEARWQDAEERCLMIEQGVREELVDEMDARLEQIRREGREERKLEGAKRDQFLDEKIAILKRGLGGEVLVYEDQRQDRIRRLEEENAVLRREITALKRERGNTVSPSKKKTLSGARVGMVLGGIENGLR